MLGSVLLSGLARQNARSVPSTVLAFMPGAPRILLDPVALVAHLCTAMLCAATIAFGAIVAPPDAGGTNDPL